MGYLDSVKIQFDVRGLIVVSGQRASVLSCNAPRELYRFQRRDSFRVRPITRTSPTARFVHPDMPGAEMSLRLVDVSIGGCGLFLPVDEPSIGRGTVVTDVRIELDSDTRVEVDMRMKHSTLVSEGARGARLGFEFVRPGGDTLRTLAALHRADAEARQADGAQLARVNGLRSPRSRHAARGQRPSRVQPVPDWSSRLSTLSE